MAMMGNPLPLSPGEVREPEAAQEQDQEWQENLNIHLICPYCQEDPPQLKDDATAGDTICMSCGTVLAARMVDTRSEWRTFSNDDQNNDDPSRVGDAANPLLNGSQLQTNIAFGDSARSKELHRAQNKATHDKSTKTLLAAYKQIGSLCDSQHLPHAVSDTAKHLFKLTDDAKAFKGKSQDAIIAGCIFIACRQNNVPRTFREIYEMTNVSKKEIGRTFKALEKFFANQRPKSQTVNTGGKYPWPACAQSPDAALVRIQPARDSLHT
ncbi:cyclin-like protein [Lineolata rhizophorae]|uniref:Transcription initiation factor IIB n=1 Tax=Lineolata rhizophorae TaxID=578093 RepID=A0A6A6NYX6_9PEZI|nr:cyclin-like protein [Lineolata rhizophorae]